MKPAATTEPTHELDPDPLLETIMVLVQNRLIMWKEVEKNVNSVKRTMR